VSGKDSEEKTLPPTQQKLKKQREKGSVVTSKETVGSVVVASVLVYLYVRRGWLGEKMTQLFLLDDEDYDRGFWYMLQVKTDLIWAIGLQIVLPVFAMVITLGILLGLAVAGGPLFSVDPLKPKFEKINPAAGFKKFFGRKAMMTFLMHIVRLSLMVFAFGFVVVAGWSALIRAPICGFGCITQALEANALPLVVAAAVLMCSTAILDFLVQRFEFLREQKMSITELRREIKDMEGDALIRARREMIGMEMAETPTGASRAVVLISNAPHELIGIRYIEDETPAPLVVIRAKGADACRRLAGSVDVPSYIDSDLAKVLSKTPVGDYVVDEPTVMALATYLQRAMAEA